MPELGHYLLVVSIDDDDLAIAQGHEGHVVIDSSRPDTSQMNLQPFFSWFLGEGWSIGYSGNILADWKAPSDNRWTVPIGVAIGKVVKLGKLPVKIQLAGQYMPIRPDNVGQEWNIQLNLSPVIPKLKGAALHVKTSLETP